MEAAESINDFRHAIKNNIIDDVLKEKIMLAVTEINGCELCDTFHSKEAKKLGIDLEVSSDISIGKINIATSKEDLAIAFSKNYTENNRKIDKEKWIKLIENFGIEGAKGVLGVVRVITLGNASGIAFGALTSRLKFKPVEGSRFFNELSVTLSILLFLPLALIRNIFR
jgi:AhpD family alkylhydroperoxidase